jgi:hypothetical protein
MQVTAAIVPPEPQHARAGITCGETVEGHPAGQDRCVSRTGRALALERPVERRWRLGGVSRPPRRGGGREVDWGESRAGLRGRVTGGEDCGGIELGRKDLASAGIALALGGGDRGEIDWRGAVLIGRECRAGLRARLPVARGLWRNQVRIGAILISAGIALALGAKDRGEMELARRGLDWARMPRGARRPNARRRIQGWGRSDLDSAGIDLPLGAEACALLIERESRTGFAPSCNGDKPAEASGRGMPSRELGGSTRFVGDALLWRNGGEMVEDDKMARGRQRGLSASRADGWVGAGFSSCARRGRTGTGSGSGRRPTSC